MKTVVSPSQQTLFDPFDRVIGSMGRKMIDQSWQGLFRQVILEQMPVAELSKQLKDTGDPTSSCTPSSAYC